MIFPARSSGLCACLVLSLCVAAGSVRADNPPKFKDPEVTAYFQKVSDITDGLLAAVQAKDEGKVKEWTGKLLETAKNAEGLKDRVSPQEDEIAARWGEAQMRRLLDAGWSPGP